MEEDSYTLHLFNESDHSLEGDMLLGQPGSALSVFDGQEEIEIPVVAMEEQMHSPLDEDMDFPCSDLDLSSDSPSRKKGGAKGRKKKFSKNLMSERKRRQRLNEKLYSLRAIVPKITKMDKASIMADAIDYVEELKSQVTEMKKEIEHIQSAALGTSTSSPESTVEDGDDSGMHHKQENKRRKTGLQIEVEKLDERETCMFRFRCSEVVFTDIAKALERLDIEVLSASINVFQGQIYSCYMAKVRNEQLMKDNLEGVVWNAIKL